MNKIFKYTAIIATTILLGACNDFLDKMPDNRTDLTDESKLVSMLTSAYPTNTHVLFTELMSDNVDDMGEKNPYTSRFYDEVYAWKDVTEVANDAPKYFWSSCYSAISSANHVLDAIERMGDANTASLGAIKAEALLARAYNHFMLVNIYSKHYNAETAKNDQGIPFCEKPETELNPQYSRGTVADVYEKIDRDLQIALPLVSDAHLKIPKYHFNSSAAYAFAARFYLYYEKWDKAIEYANKCLGNNAKTMLRNWQYMSTMPQGNDGREAICNRYIAAEENCNLLLATAPSAIGLVMGPYTIGKRYTHNSYLSKTETSDANNLWGTVKYWMTTKKYTATNADFTIFWKLPYLFEVTDPIANIGIYRTVCPLLTADECLLNRAEAYVMTKQYDKATQDLNTWMSNILTTSQQFTTQQIVDFYNSVDYSYNDDKKMESTIKKHLQPSFAIDAEGSVQENLLQACIGLRRIETLHAGLRWFDIKRYGIKIPRRVLNAAAQPEKVVDWLTVDDDRRALQIPQEALDAGLAPTPRNK